MKEEKSYDTIAKECVESKTDMYEYCKQLQREGWQHYADKAGMYRWVQEEKTDATR